MSKIFIVAVERSGDDLGAGLIKAIRNVDQNISVTAIGGSAMDEAGAPSQMSIDGLSILGFVEGIKHYPMILRKVSECCDQIIESEADAVILIDSWGFMIRVAKKLRKAGFKGKIIKYVAPQVWAMRSGRSKILARYTDLLLSIQPMDKPYFEPHGLQTVYVGNPVFDTDYRNGSAEKIHRLVKKTDGQILSVWFGSRASEIDKLSKDFIDTIKILKRDNPNLLVVSAVANSVKRSLSSTIKANDADEIITLVDEALKKDVMAASDIALACSGTVTTQLASAGVPTIVAYRLNGLTYLAAKKLFKPSYISIVNIAADEGLMPEFIQDEATPSRLSTELTSYLNDPQKRQKASQALLSQTRKMGAGRNNRSNEKAANVILTALQI